ncbi:adenosine deaminase [Legionella sp. PC997]|uniref:adenosine deaminase family protein n=1 Tax=Legionella sp. PC997 TaxID=2755562 RepID=UPI0018627794|nr:adenosine deaminase [Legionella sp. PC997]QMT61636.1 adenosine deaminase [Legionella sp. PC997]
MFIKANLFDRIILSCKNSRYFMQIARDMNKFFYVFCFLIVQIQAYASPEENTQAYFDSIKSTPRLLKKFLTQMPKGGDLHMHVSGSSFPENLIHYAQMDDLCIENKNLSVFINPSCNTEDYLANAVLNNKLYNSLIDAWSMRHFDKMGNESGHDHFFNAFGKFSLITKMHGGEILAEMTERAAAQNELYLEIMTTPDGNEASQLGKSMGWNPNLEYLRNQLLSANFDQIVTNISLNLNKDEAKKNALQQCGTQNEQAGCEITVRYLYQVRREQPPEMVFAQLLAGFESASHDPRIVGINMVQTEDGPISMRDYRLHMQMVAFLHQLYPNVHITLHAGELNPQLVTPDGLTFHIHEAVETASAERIGHGVDIQYEYNASELINKMAQKEVLVEVNLSSNDYILGIKGDNHPLALYLKYGVPVALSTDDEGISLEPLTRQYERAVEEQKLSYLTLKQLARNSLYYSFLPGDNLWENSQYKIMNPLCPPMKSETEEPIPACENFLKMNQKAQLQWKLEEQFAKFESQY